MTWQKCVWSILVPWHNEWLNIWLYIGFALYFWIQSIFIMAHYTKQYKFKYERNWDFMYIATLSIAISLTVTAAYLTLYSVSDNWNKLLNAFDYMGKLIFFFGYTFAYVGSGLFDSKLYFPFMFLVAVVLISNLVVLQFEIGRKITFWISIAVLCVIYLYDFWFFSNSKEKKVFYIPMFVEGIILLAAYLLYIFELPERLCRGSRFVQLYLTGFTIYTLFFINFIFEAHNILYYAVKLNAGNYDDYDDDWWRLDNIVHKD